MFWFFSQEAGGILIPRPGIETASPTLEGEVLTTGPPGKSPIFIYLFIWLCQVLFATLGIFVAACGIFFF